MKYNEENKIKDTLYKLAKLKSEKKWIETRLVELENEFKTFEGEILIEKQLHDMQYDEIKIYMWKKMFDKIDRFKERRLEILQEINFFEPNTTNKDGDASGKVSEIKIV